jgi:hypothetical protein
MNETLRTNTPSMKPAIGEFFSTFTAGKSRNSSSGDVSGRYEVAGTTLLLRGLWNEQGTKND